jgi:large subunit ribosomal protein L29
MMKAEDIRDWDDTEIQARLKELKEEQFKLRFQGSMMELENPSIVRTIRRDIARLNTVLRERELAQNG